jgi:RNA polymerase sigma-70 factor (ECF subfamily)
MDEHEWLAERFQAHRAHLRTVAYRLLGSPGDADDAVQEAWLRVSRADTSGVENMGGWLTTVVSRVCLNMLQSRKSRREESLGTHLPEPPAPNDAITDPEHEAVLADSVGLALLVVLETLSPAERVAFVLHDMFDLPFHEIAPIVGRTPAAARKLASRARLRVRGAEPDPDADLNRRRQIVDAFLAASRGGDFQALLELLDPGVVLRADNAAVQASAARRAASAPELAPEVRGAAAVAEMFKGRAAAAQPALVNGTPGLAWAPGGQARAVLSFAIDRGKIIGIDVIADPESIRKLDLTLLGD